MPTARAEIVQIQAKIQWKGARDPRTGRWIGVCDALNLNAVGDTWQELQECANQAMELLFADLFAEGELEAFLSQNKWKKVGEPEEGVTPRFDIPVDWDRQSNAKALYA